ncbi:MAG: Ref family recombination enhancement nuclease [Plesiomonas shigelloides]
MLIKKTEKLSPYERKIQAARRAQERQQARRQAQMNDPVWQEEQREKRRTSAQRAWDKQKAKAEAARVAPAPEPVKPATSKKKTSRKPPERTPTADERRHMDKVGKLPCIACYLKGVLTWYISLHHTQGRTAPRCHFYVLPLCEHHHQVPPPAEVMEKYPWLIPIHAYLRVGGKHAFEQAIAPVDELLALVDSLIQQGGEGFDGVLVSA